MDEKDNVTKDDGITIKFNTQNSQMDGDNDQASGADADDDDEEEEEEDFEGIAFPATSPVSNISSSSGKKNKKVV